MTTNRSFRKSNRRGNYSMLMGVTGLIVIGFAAFSVDISLITMAELQAQAAADAASHAALVGYRENQSVVDGTRAANHMITVNEVAMGTATIDLIQFGKWNFNIPASAAAFQNTGGVNSNAARVEVSRRGGNTVDLLLAPLLGVLTHDVDGESITSQQQRAIMLIQDMSCSMMTGIPDDEESPIELSRQANIGFLDFLLFRPQDGDLLGLAMFSQEAAAPPVLGVHPWGGTGLIPWLSLSLLENEEPLVRERINGICDTTVGGPVDIGQPGPLDDLCRITLEISPHCPLEGIGAPCSFPAGDVGACTNPEPAMNQAINELQTNADDGYFRGIVLMSDGLPNCGIGGPADVRAKAAANFADSLGISIWTIVFVPEFGFDPTFMGCDPTDADSDGVQDDPGLTRGIGFCQSASDPTKIDEMYRKVAESLPTAFVL